MATLQVHYAGYSTVEARGVRNFITQWTDEFATEHSYPSSLMRFAFGESTDSDRVESMKLIWQIQM